jgi:hypothetical protein
MRKLLLITLLLVAVSAFGQIVPGVWRNEYGGEFTLTRIYRYRWHVLPLNSSYIVDKDVVGLGVAGSRDLEYYTVQQINNNTWLLTSVDKYAHPYGYNALMVHREQGRPFWIQRVQ